jgi:hypothetical protein
MEAFDAVRYLRMLGEKEGADSDSDWRAGPIDDAAAALVAVGAIAADRARSVLSEYGRVPEVDAAITTDHVTGRRVAALDADVRLPSGTLRLSHAVLGDEGATIRASYRAEPEHQRIHHDWIRVPSGWPSALDPPRLTDDRGTEVELTFHGSGNDDRWRARLLTESPIALDTAWLEIYGARITCIDDRPRVQVTIESLDQDDPARRHLWRCLARSDRDFDKTPTQATVDALVASGALPVADPVLQQLEAVRRCLPSPHVPESKRPRGFRALPDPWPSLIQRSARRDGPTGLVLIATEMPALGRQHVAVDVLDSDPASFTVITRQSPEPGPDPSLRGPVEDRELIWWARDDRGNSYLMTRFNNEHQLRSTTALDPLATSLDLMPTAIVSRAVISFPLQWVTSDVRQPRSAR